jgi:hypothetical protein
MSGTGRFAHGPPGSPELDPLELWLPLDDPPLEPTPLDEPPLEVAPLEEPPPLPGSPGSTRPMQAADPPTRRTVTTRNDERRCPRMPSG